MSDGPFIFIAVACGECGRVTMNTRRVPAMITLDAAKYFAREAGYYESEIDHRWYCGECFPDPDDAGESRPPNGPPVEDPPTF